MPPHLKSLEFTHIEWLAHGFFGRKGGVSSNEFESLNSALQKGDISDNVCQNRQFMANALLMENAPIIFMCQNHTTVVHVLDAPLGDEIPIADAIVTRKKNIIIGIQTADCVPVLFVDPVTHVIGAAHAGWSGLANGILQNTVKTMIELGANKESIKAAIGPCIWPESYEVGANVKESFSDFHDLFKPWPGISNISEAITYSFDLPMAAYRTLQNAGILDISSSSKNTYENPTDYFSFRKSTHNKDIRFGRQASLIGMIA